MGEVITVRVRSLDYVHPRAREQFAELLGRLDLDYRDGLLDLPFAVFETYRSPAHQTSVNQAGNSLAEAFWSAHQYGLAMDVVPRHPLHGFRWDAPTKDWDRLRARAHELGLLNDISWDRAHVEHPLWQLIRVEMLHYRPSVAG